MEVPSSLVLTRVELTPNCTSYVNLNIFILLNLKECMCLHIYIFMYAYSHVYVNIDIKEHVCIFLFVFVSFFFFSLFKRFSLNDVCGSRIRIVWYAVTVYLLGGFLNTTCMI